VWALYIGSIPIYDYSLGVRVHPPLDAISVVDLVYSGSTYDGKAIASPSVESRKYNNRKANAIKTEIEVVSIFNLVKIFLLFLKKLKFFFYEL